MDKHEISNYEQGQWCTDFDKAPDGNNYQVTIENKHGRFVTMSFKYSKDTWLRVSDGGQGKGRMIAWRPLADPYNG